MKLQHSNFSDEASGGEGHACVPRRPACPGSVCGTTEAPLVNNFLRNGFIFYCSDFKRVVYPIQENELVRR